MAYPRDIEINSEYMTVDDNGMVLQWCHGVNSDRKCRHYITTREDITQTGLCKELFHMPKYLSWRMQSGEEIPQAEMIKWLRHQPYCKSCLSDMNSYLFPAWYDLSREDVEKVVSLYGAYYPRNIRQPFFHVMDDRKMLLRLEVETSDADDGGGELDIETMQAEFFIYSQLDNIPEGMSEEEYDKTLELYFDLSKPEGWEEMLERFPQKGINE